MQFEDPSGKLMMLPSDIALIQDKSFRQYVKMYAKDGDLFKKDFAVGRHARHARPARPARPARAAHASDAPRRRPPPHLPPPLSTRPRCVRWQAAFQKLEELGTKNLKTVNI